MSNKHSALKRFFYTSWHRFTSRRFSVRFFIFKFLIILIWSYVFIYPPFVSGKFGADVAISIIIAFIAYSVFRSYPFIPTFQRKFFQKEKIKRKIMTADVLDKMIEHSLAGIPRTPTIGISLLEQILQVITNHVRTFRHDQDGDKIYSNLLIEHDEENLKVIARNMDVNRGFSIYKKSDLLAWSSMTHKRVEESGDIFLDFPSTPVGKPYKSVLVIPIIHEDRAIAVLSIDSSEPYHFTNIAENINTRLLSYAVLLKKVLLEYSIVSL